MLLMVNSKDAYNMGLWFGSNSPKILHIEGNCHTIDADKKYGYFNGYNARFYIHGLQFHKTALLLNLRKMATVTSDTSYINFLFFFDISRPNTLCGKKKTFWDISASLGFFFFRGGGGEVGSPPVPPPPPYISVGFFARRRRKIFGGIEKHKESNAPRDFYFPPRKMCSPPCPPPKKKNPKRVLVVKRSWKFWNVLEYYRTSFWLVEFVQGLWKVLPQPFFVFRLPKQVQKKLQWPQINFSRTWQHNSNASRFRHTRYICNSKIVSKNKFCFNLKI